MLILPFPNSAVFFTNSVRYLSSSISPGMATACPPEALISSATFFAFATSTHQHCERTALTSGKRCRLTSVNVRDNHLRALVGEQSRGLCANALPRSSDYSDLAGKHTLGEVQMSSYLLDTFARHVCCRERRCTVIEGDDVENLNLLSWCLQNSSVETATVNRDGEVESKRRASASLSNRAVRLSHPYLYMR